jgi:hypothetical protein
MTATTRHLAINILGSVLASGLAALLARIYQYYRKDQASPVEVVLVFVTVLSLATSLPFLRYYVSVAYRSGIVGVAHSHAYGKGSPKVILPRVRQNFCFMGVAARKWLECPQFTPMLGQVGPRRGGEPYAPVRILILSPDSRFATDYAAYDATPEWPLRDRIEDTVKKVAGYRKLGFDIDLRLYADPPLFRLAFVDDEWLYLGYYRPLSSGENSPQLMLDNRRVPRSFYRDFKAYFDHKWKESTEPDWSLYGSEAATATKT